MSGVGVTQPRWRLPARRRKFITVAAPVAFAAVFVGLSLGGQWRIGLGLGLAFAGLVWLLSVVVVRLEPDPGPPDPPRLFTPRADKRFLLAVVRRGQPIAPAEAARLRPMAEQIGRDSARGLLGSVPLMLTIIGMALARPAGWQGVLVALAGVICLVGVVLQWRDRRACAAFLDRY